MILPAPAVFRGGGGKATIKELVFVENVTYAKIMGLAVDEDGRPAFGYMKLEGVKLQKETVAQLMHTPPDTVVMLTEEEYKAEVDDE